MRRSRQTLADAEIEDILARGTHGILAVSGDDAYPYAVPVSYCYENGKIWFHSAVTGHKLDAVRRDDKVSFCVVDLDQIEPERYTTYFRSVIAFGKARVLEEPEEKRRAFLKLAMKYSPDDETGCRAEVERQFTRAAVVEIAVEHVTGKEAIELVRRKADE